MDHLPTPQNGFPTYPKVRYLGIFTVPNDDYEGGPNISRRSFSKHQFLGGRDEVPSLSDAAPFLQAWLWFGLLDNIFDIVGVELEPLHFVVDDESLGQRLSTHALHRYFWYWATSEATASDSDREHHADLIKAYIDEAFSVLNAYIVEQAVPRSSATSESQNISKQIKILDDDSSNVLLGIALLAEALDTARMTVYRRYHEGWSKLCPETRSIRTSLLEAGWCSREIERIMNHFGSACVTLSVFLCRIDRRVFGKDHSKCTTNECRHEKIDYDKYRPAHVSPTCLCCVVAPRYASFKQMDRAVCTGKVPVVTFSRKDIFGYRLDIHSVSMKEKPECFVAISHVWSDRLGNLHDNALPECQLLRLQSLVNALYPNRRADVPFWMDTICVPRDRTARALAITNMHNIYEKADKVLVLDSSLLSVSSFVAPVELFCRIMLAPWSSRLWTYHEGALAVRLYFQLADSAIAGDDIDTRYRIEAAVTTTGTTRLEDILGDEDNEPMRRALVRAMALDEKQEHFVDFHGEALKPRTFELSYYDAHDTGVPLFPSYVKYAYERMQDEETSGQVSAPDNESMAIYSRSENGETVHENTAQMQAETQRRDQLEKLMLAKGADLASQLERKTVNSMGGYAYRQVLEKNLDVKVPPDWLGGQPTSMDKQVANEIKRISTTLCHFWLREFDPLHAMGYTWYNDLRTSFKRSILNMYTDVVPDYRQIEEVIFALNWRTTSWVEDEAICFAIILGMEVEQVQQGHAQDRMKILAGLWDCVPRRLAFCDLKRLQSPGFGWMPQSILGVGHQVEGLWVNLDDRDVGRRTERGLQFLSDGVMFDFGTLPAGADSVAFEMAGTFFEVWIPINVENGGSGSWSDVEKQRAAVLFEETPPDSSRGVVKGVVASVIEESEEVIFVSHKFCVRIETFDKMNDAYLIPRIDVRGSDQLWCLG